MACVLLEDLGDVHCDPGRNRFGLSVRSPPAPIASEAQPSEKIPRVGLLSLFSRSVVTPWHQAFRLGLGDLGWVEGKNISFEYRYADGRRDRLPDLAADLVRLKVAVIVTSADSDTQAAKNATAEVPIVMACPTDPVDHGPY